MKRKSIRCHAILMLLYRIACENPGREWLLSMSPADSMRSCSLTFRQAGNKMSRYVRLCLSMAIGLACSAGFISNFNRRTESLVRLRLTLKLFNSIMIEVY